MPQDRSFWTPAILLTIILVSPAQAQYHTWSGIETALLNAETNYPALCRRVSLGQTVQGRTMWALCISDDVGVEEDEPEFRYISTMHGDEVIGVENCLSFIDYLTTNSGVDPRVTHIVDSIEIWIVPCMNPDGFVAGTRTNANGIDLNRNFPDPFTSPSNTTAGRAIETANIMNWCFGRSFTLAANFHGGALVVNYPFDNNASGQSVYSASPDDDLFIRVSEGYSSHNLPMWNSATFFHGITNGADWYVIAGGMQDWSYRYMGANEVTIELGADKRPPAADIPTYWNNNRESMLSYLEFCLTGVRGIVTDAAAGTPLSATIRVVGRDHDVFTDSQIGDYHRMLPPGTFDLTIQSGTYDPVALRNVPVGPGDATRMDAALWRTTVMSPNGGEIRPPDVSGNVAWSGDPSAQFHVQYSPNSSTSGSQTDGFESGSLSAAYSTGGDLPWTVVTGSPHLGAYSARAGPITHGQTTWLTRTASAGAMSFWYRVSSETNYDWFNFYIDGQQQVHRSGTVAWTQYATVLAAGTHTLKWEYAKDGSVSSGSDTAWVDDVITTESGADWSDIVALTPPGAQSTAWTPATPGQDYKVRVRSYRSAEGYGPWDESDAPFTICRPGDTNHDFLFTAADTAGFITVLLDPMAGDAYSRCAADLNHDGAIDGRDVQMFVNLL